jgi:hypothetical protein
MAEWALNAHYSYIYMYVIIALFIACHVMLLGRQVYVERSPNVGVSRTVFKTAPPHPGPHMDNMDSYIYTGDTGPVNIVDVIIFYNCLFNNINFSGYIDAEYQNFLFYKVVSIFSCDYALALSFIHTHIVIKYYYHHRHQHSIHSIFIHKAGSTSDAVTVGTTTVQGPGTKNLPGSVICLVSPNGD